MYSQSDLHKLSNPYIKDVQSIDTIIKASYEVVSGEKGAKRQWERDLFLHHPKAIYSFTDRTNPKHNQVTMTIGEFHKETDDMIIQTAFFETEINREVRTFGNIAHVWSTYETQLEKDGPVVRRGINSIQLFFENNRWYIISWIFDKELDNNRIPKTFDRN
ncbi:hypothetical protein [Elizabethkingia meningoseptica]|uniref:hypothetical protein n=1 Tax=Elizabethkingia meningoseptica TaxID=238 RepID=UPI003892488E